MEGIVIFAILVALVIIFVARGFIIVKQAETIVIERLGKFHRLLTSGINIIIPFLDQPRTMEWRFIQVLPGGKSIVRIRRVSRIDLRETVYDFPRQNVITSDNVVTEINALLYFQVIDPVKALYEIANLPDAIEKLTQTTLRNVVGEMDLDETLSSRDQVNNKLRAILDEATDKWGVKVNRVELQEINPPQDIRAAMEKQMRAERDRRAAILEAEGLKRAAILKSEGTRESAVNRAEGDKQAAILRATGEAEAIRQITESIRDSGGNPSTYLIAIKYIETLKEMVSGKDNKVIYLPVEATGILSSLGGIKEMLEGATQISPAPGKKA